MLRNVSIYLLKERLKARLMSKFCSGCFNINKEGLDNINQSCQYERRLKKVLDGIIGFAVVAAIRHMADEAPMDGAAISGAPTSNLPAEKENEKDAQFLHAALSRVAQTADRAERLSYISAVSLYLSVFRLSISLGFCGFKAK